MTRSIARSKLIRFVLLGATAALVAFAPGTASASRVRCGQVVTKSIKLDSDLNCPPRSTEDPGPGLTVGADKITIDLNGYTLSGDVEGSDPPPVGIDNSAGFDKVTIRDGVVRGFQQAIALQGASRNRLSNLEADARYGGVGLAIFVVNSDRNLIERVRALGFDLSLLLAGSRNRVQDSDLGGFRYGVTVRGSRTS